MGLGRLTRCCRDARFDPMTWFDRHFGRGRTEPPNVSGVSRRFCPPPASWNVRTNPQRAVTALSRGERFILPNFAQVPQFVEITDLCR